MARVVRRGTAAPLLALALLLADGCGGPAPSGAAPPAVAVTSPPARLSDAWVQALTFSGDVQGAMDHVIPAGAGARSECSGRNSRPAGAWASALFGAVGREVYEVLVMVRPYRGPGSYRAPEVTVQVARPDGSAVWQTSGGDTATFTIGLDEESGSVSATLTNLASTATKLRLDGRWSCRA